MHTSRPYGYPIGDKDSSSRKFVTNMHSIVKTGGDQAMFMRTAMVTVCSDISYIHGIKVALQHDPEKDPARNQYVETFYSHDKIEKQGIKNDHIYFDKLLGIEDGFCESLTIPDGERIKAIMVYSSNNVIRNLEFKLSDGTMKKFGKHMDYTGAGR